MDDLERQAVKQWSDYFEEEEHREYIEDNLEIEKSPNLNAEDFEDELHKSHRYEECEDLLDL